MISNIAFVVFEEEASGGSPGRPAGSSLLGTYPGMALYRFFHKSGFDSGIEVVRMEDEESILLIGLPFPKSMLSRLNKRYLMRYISRKCAEYGCARCFYLRAPTGQWRYS